jgi:hypothetical protein
VGTVNRTQAGLLRKSVFDGEWFVRRTVIDVPYDVGYTFIGEMDEVQRVRWEIQRDFILAYRVHPLINDTESAAPVAVFAVEDHVDVKREYNPSTGEPTNVVVEDSRDRYWYEREFVRVDWSQNLVTNFGFVVSGLEQEPVAYTIEEPQHPDRLLLGTQESGGQWRDEQDPARLLSWDTAQYLDVVTKMLVTPESIWVEDEWGDVVAEPACWYYLNYDCAPAVLTVRTAFLRVDAALSDYEPLEYPDNTVARDEDGSAIYVEWDENGNRRRLDEAPSVSDPSLGDSASAFTPADPYAPSPRAPLRIPFFDKFGYFRTERYGYDEQYGEVYAAREQLINRWNIWGKSYGSDGEALPYRDRGYRPIVYYLSPDFPPELLAAAQSAVDQWNAALRATADALDGDNSPPRLFELRANTREVDPDTGAVVRRGEPLGDLRYSHLYAVQAPTRAGLLGYGPASVDPLTGEIFQADAIMYLGPAKLLAARGRDVVELILGRIDPVDLALGEVVEGYLAALRKGALASAPTNPDEVRAFARSHTIPGAPGGAGHAKPGTKAGAQAGGKAAAQSEQWQKQLRRPAGWADARLSAVRGTSVEQLLAADPMVSAMRDVPTQGGAAVQSLGASPLQWGLPSRRAEGRDRIRRYAERNITMAVFADDAVAGLALSLADESSDEVYTKILESVFRSTAEHEVGHTLGLRHNFEGSTDALNFHDHYWELRGNSPAPMAELDDRERRGRLREFQYSSIMDYAGRFNADIQGLGHYDRAAIAFGYGQLVEVFDQAPDEPLVEVREVDEGTFSRPFTLDTVFRSFRHYTSYPRILGGVDGIRSRSLAPYTKRAAELAGMASEESLEAQLLGEAPWTRWEVPYRFCSDEYVFGTQTCHAYDMGADSYEIVKDAVDRYWAYYYFNNFQRDQVFFDEWGYLDSMYWRYFGFMHNAFQHWIFDQWFTAETWEFLRSDPEGNGIEDLAWTEAVDGGLTSTAAAMEGMRFMQAVLAAPEPGAYWYDPTEGYYWTFAKYPYPICEGESAWYNEAWCSDVNIDLGEARYFLSTYDWESGYAFYERIKWVGSFYDKLLALETLTNPDTYFLGVDTSQSVDQWALSMYLAFPEELHRVFSGIAADRFDLYAGYIDADGKYHRPDPFDRSPRTLEQQLAGPVDPQTSFTVQLYALWYSMALLNANFDNTFNDYAKIWLAGSGEAIDLEETAEFVEFANPFNGRVYQTLYPEGQREGLGATLLLQAQRYLDEYFEVEADPTADPSTLEYMRWRVENATSNIEVTRGLFDLYGLMYF